MNNPSIFLTDYASYNNGTQFEFGHWVDLTDFSDADELNDYITEHFEKCDEKSPLGSPREETMITDYENFPEIFYSESSMNFEDLYNYLDLEDYEKHAIEFLMDQGLSYDDAFEKYEDVSMTEDSTNAKYDLFEMVYPEAEAMEQSNSYLTIDYDRFIKENYTEFETEDGTSYYVCDTWNH